MKDINSDYLSFIKIARRITYEAVSIKFFSMWGSSFLTRTSKPVTFCSALKDCGSKVRDILCECIHAYLHGDVFELRLDLDRLPSHNHNYLLLIV